MRTRRVASILCGIAIFVVGFIAPTQAVQAAGRATRINFDNQNAPDIFDHAIALRRVGRVLFSGPTSLGGGAIVDDATFGSVSGQSSPNFLAFSTTGTLSNGGAPVGPETITFPSRVRLVKVKAGSTDAVHPDISVTAFTGPDGTGTILGTRTLTATPALASLSFSTRRHVIRSVVVSATTAHVWILDDLVAKR